VALLAQAIANELPDVLEGRFAFFGYSYGSIVAFELTRELRRRQAPTPEHLFVCAAEAPQQPRRLDPVRFLADAQFLTKIGQRYGPLPPMLLADPEALRLALGILRADLEALETYTCEHEPPLPCAITALRGRDDVLVGSAAFEAWRHHTGRQFAAYILHGDHFFLKGSTDQVLAIVREQLDLVEDGCQLPRPPFVRENGKGD
jgi:surfactin synthase thioesterase subunit